jgi:S-adenosylmethionine hydrolase
MKSPVITLLTDFGLADHYVAAMKGVILGICPQARLIDISHEIKAFDIEDAAFALNQTYPYYPFGTIHLVVVDPGVGSARRPMVVEACGQRFVAPDNGVLTGPLKADPEYRAWRIGEERFFRQPVSRSFHGRDIFAPVSAHLAAGASPASFGESIGDAVVLDWSEPTEVTPGHWSGEIRHIDRYGNLVTNFDQTRFGEVETAPFSLEIEGAEISRFAANYAEIQPGGAGLVRGSSGMYEVSVNQGDASRLLAVGRGTPLQLSLGSASTIRRTGTVNPVRG